MRTRLTPIFCWGPFWALFVQNAHLDPKVDQVGNRKLCNSCSRSLGVVRLPLSKLRFFSTSPCQSYVFFGASPCQSYVFLAPPPSILLYTLNSAVYIEFCCIHWILLYTLGFSPDSAVYIEFCCIHCFSPDSVVASPPLSPPQPCAHFRLICCISPLSKEMLNC